MQKILLGIGFALLALGLGWVHYTHPVDERPVAPIIVTVPPPVIASCRVSGDSIAVMTIATKVLSMCDAVPCDVKIANNKAANAICTAMGSMNAAWILDHIKPGADVAIISVLSNNILDWHKGTMILRDGHMVEKRQLLGNPAEARKHLDAIRAKANAKVVVWIRPFLIEPGEMIDKYAAEKGDIVVSFVAGSDGVHPKNPATLARDILAKVPALKDIKK